MGTEPVRVGLAFNTRRTSSPEVDDREAEFDTPETIGAIADAIASHGYEVVELELDEAFPNALVSAKVDLVFNIAEGSRGRMRESLVPALCEFHGIPVTGSDGATLAICLDKDLTKRVLRGTIERSRVAEELRLPDYRVFDEAMPRELDLRFPVIVKPIGEGSSKGVFPESVAFDEAGVRRLVGEIVRRYEQPAIVEEYITGREVTVGILGNREDPGSLISYTDLAGLARLRAEGRIADGMLPKAMAIEDALRGGVRRVHVVSYHSPEGILGEVFTNEGTGTLIVADVNALSPAEQQSTP